MSDGAIGLFYGSTNGTTAALAAQIRDEFAAAYGVTVELVDIGEFALEEMQDFDKLILGVPTWNVGQLQRDWEAAIDEFDDLDLTGRLIAVFGPGDQVGYPDTFGDALVFVAERAEAQGAVLVGLWPTVGYTFSRSWAVRGDRFVGLLLDEDNQPELTELRLRAWVAQLAREFGIAPERRK